MASGAGCVGGLAVPLRPRLLSFYCDIHGVQAELKWDPLDELKTGASQDKVDFSSCQPELFTGTKAAAIFLIVSKYQVSQNACYGSDHRENETTVRFEYASNLLHRGRSAGKVVQGSYSRNSIESFVSEWKTRCIGDDNICPKPRIYIYPDATACVVAQEVIVTAADIADTTSEPRQHHFQPLAFEHVH
jgi:hypothetical protein